MQLYFTELIKTLDSEDRNWRSNTIIMMDNASYHDSKDVLELFQKQRVPVMYLGAYSYHMAPAEMVFAALKVQLLNEDQVQLGKR